MDEKKALFKLCSMTNIDDEAVIKTVLNIEKMLEKEEIPCFMNNSIWFFSKQGYIQYTDILKKKGCHNYYMAVIDYVFSKELDSSSTERSVYAIYSLPTEMKYEDFYSDLTSHRFDSNNDDCSCSNILLFSQKCQMIWFINQRYGYTKMVSNPTISNFKYWTRCMSQIEGETFIKENTLF